jgi:cellulose synthase/poly-beta-1,6-N-acetylglucosamine synthase-like glycosyltransferase
MHVLLLAGAFFVLAQHPFLTYPLSLLAIRAWRGRRAPVRLVTEGRPASVALLVCAFNEERCLPEKLADLGAQLDRHPDLEIRIYSDGSTDRTPALLAAADPRIEVTIGRERRGKGPGINALMVETKAELVILSDANVLLAPDVVDRVRAHLSSPEVGLICGTVERLVGDAASPAVTAAYYRMEQWLKRLESEIDTTIMTDGSLHALRRALFRPIRPDLMDDASTSTAILCGGHRMLQVDDVRGRERDNTGFWRELQRKRRIACQAYRCHREMQGELRRLSFLRAYMYRSHKVLRWFSGALLAAASILVLAWVTWTSPRLTMLALLLALGAIVITGLLSRGLLERVASVAGALTFASLGVFDALRGRTYIPWTPVRSE